MTSWRLAVAAIEADLIGRGEVQTLPVPDPLDFEGGARWLATYDGHRVHRGGDPITRYYNERDDAVEDRLDAEWRAECAADGTVCEAPTPAIRALERHWQEARR